MNKAICSRDTLRKEDFMSKKDKKIATQKQEVTQIAEKEEQVKPKRNKVGRLVVIAILMFFVGCIGFACGQVSSEKKANAKVEVLRQQIMKEAPTIYQEKINLEVEFVEELKEYRQWIIEKNSNSVLFTNYIDSMIREYISKARSEEGYENIVPMIQDTKALFNADKYFEEYLKELDEIEKKYQLSYPVNRTIKRRLDEIEETYTSKINSTDVLSKLFDLQGRCEENLQFWEEIGNLD